MAEAAGKKLYTLTEVAKKTKISMPTLQRYKKLYQDRIPSEGAGRKQRYPESALAVFRELKTENIGRRGRPRKSAAARAAPAKRATKSKRGRKPAAKTRSKAAAASEELLTLTQISKLTAVSYPTLLRYVKSHLKEIPHSGTGRARRFKPEAVEVFKRLRSQSRRGRKPKAASAAAPAAKRKSTAKRKVAARRGRPRKEISSADLIAEIRDLKRTQKAMSRDLERMKKQLAKPIRLVGQR